MKALSRYCSFASLITALITLCTIGAAATLRAEVTNDMLLNAAKESDNWRMAGRDYAGSRFSPLKQVNTKNIKRLFRNGLFRWARWMPRTRLRW